MKRRIDDDGLRAGELSERDHQREPRSFRRPRRELAGRDALQISMAVRTAPVAEDDPTSETRADAQPIDLDMRPRDVDAANRRRAYLDGWRTGARHGAQDSRATGHADEGIRRAYSAGYDAGVAAYSRAVMEAGGLSGYEPSVLRTAAAAAPDQVITTGEVAEALGAGAMEREHAERASRPRPRGGRR